eukprot:gene8622-biopygen21163
MVVGLQFSAASTRAGRCKNAKIQKCTRLAPRRGGAGARLLQRRAVLRCGGTARRGETRKWRATHPLTVPHLMCLSVGGLISQSQIAGKCTNDAADTTELNDSASNAPKNVWKTGEQRRRRRERGNLGAEGAG